MEEMKFDPNAIKHVRGQNERIEDTGKAMLMAERENDSRPFADMYAGYLKEPTREAFFDAHPGVPDGTIEIMEKLADAKVSLEYMHRIAEANAEADGKVFDWKKRIEGMAISELQNMLRRLDGELALNQTERDKHFNPKESAFMQSPEYSNLFIDEVIAVSTQALIREELSRRSRGRSTQAV